MKTELEPKLAPPGAGLPKAELFVARLMFNRRLRTGSRQSFTDAFREEREAVQKLYQSCDTESGAKRILIKRVRGLEDSSRYWSVWMTLEHLRMVHGGMTRIISTLATGVMPTNKVNTANVKPSPQVLREAVEPFERSCDDLLATVEGVVDLNTEARHEHPWFGSLNAAGWHALAASHLSIHRTQMERILKGLSARA